MPQEFCTVRSIAKPFSMPLAGSTTTTLSLHAPTTIVWDDGQQDVWVLDGFTVTSMYDGTAAIDTFNFVWLIIAVKGVVNSARLVKEVDYANIDTVLGAGHQWAAIYRILGTDYEEFQQAGSGAGTALPTGLKGDVFYLPVAGNNWQPLHGTKGGLLYFDPISGEPIWLNPTKGDLVRGNLIGGNLIWERYPLTAGIQGDVLINDRTNSGLPIWSSSSTAPPISVGSSITSVKMLYLWNGSSNNFPPGNWQLPTYDDSGWIPPLDVTAAIVAAGGTPIPGTQFLWATAGTVPATAGALFRLNFTLGPGFLSSATLQLQIDDECTGCWVNNVLVYAHANQSVGDTVGVTLTIPPGYLAQGTVLNPAKNTIAVAHYNVYPPGAYVDYKLTIS